MRRGRAHLRLAAALTATVALALAACQPTPVPTAPGTTRVVVFGDSLPNWLIRDGGKTPASATAVTLVDGSLAACEGAAGNPPARSRTGAIVPTPAECAKGWPSQYPPHLTIRADVAVVMAGTHAMLDHQLDGVWRHPCHTPARTWYQKDLEGRLKLLGTKADRVVLVIPAWPTAKSQWIMPADFVARADCVRAVSKAAARATGATVLDLGTYLCPTGAASCNDWRSKDGMHVDTGRAPTVLTWLLRQVTA